jgi:hypothetical protein
MSTRTGEPRVPFAREPSDRERGHARSARRSRRDGAQLLALV